MDWFNVFIILFLFVICLIFLVIVSSLFYYILTFLRDRFFFNNIYFTNSKIKYLLVVFLLIYSTYLSYTAVYPTDEFYFDEFYKITNKEIPNSAEILFKDSSYPDFHGDYFSKSKIQLSETDYKDLYEELKTDSSLINQKGVFSKKKIRFNNYI